MSTRNEVITPEALRAWALPAPGSSKRSRGTVLVAGGSPSTPGGAMLAGLAALRVGSGVLALAVARSVASAVAAAVPEASVFGLRLLDGEDGDDFDELTSGRDVVLVGPGLDDPDRAAALVNEILDHAAPETRFVLDAFALGVLSETKDQDVLSGRAVLTPNPAEAARLLTAGAGELADRPDEDVAEDIASRFGVVVSYQDAVASADGRRWTVPRGHPGLGTSGSGDVLAGAITGLMARGAELEQAACWGTYLHKVAGERLGHLGFLARELATELAAVLADVAD
jgi:ADP-dependent NAD(P)H-hydrate dehydratase